MTSHSKGSPFFDEQIDGVDANVQGNTEAIDIQSVKDITWSVVGVSGSHNNHVIRLQRSLDGVSWSGTSHSVTGEDSEQQRVTARFVRWRVTTPEGSPSTVNIHIQGKE